MITLYEEGRDSARKNVSRYIVYTDMPVEHVLYDLTN